MALNDSNGSLEALWELVRSIPRGRCVSYGDIGRALPNPASGFQVGRWMANAPADIPWWRVVARDGSLPVHKKDPRIAEQQAELLCREGVPCVEGRVEMESARWEL